jgi:hypothetical protein
MPFVGTSIRKRVLKAAWLFLYFSVPQGNHVTKIRVSIVRIIPPHNTQGNGANQEGRHCCKVHALAKFLVYGNIIA